MIWVVHKKRFRKKISKTINNKNEQKSSKKLAKKIAKKLKTIISKDKLMAFSVPDICNR